MISIVTKSFKKKHFKREAPNTTAHKIHTIIFVKIKHCCGFTFLWNSTIFLQVYIGAVNRIYQLTPDLEIKVSEVTGPKMVISFVYSIKLSSNINFHPQFNRIHRNVLCLIVPRTSTESLRTTQIKFCLLTTAHQGWLFAGLCFRVYAPFDPRKTFLW